MSEQHDIRLLVRRDGMLRFVCKTHYRNAYFWNLWGQYNDECFDAIAKAKEEMLKKLGMKQWNEM